MSIKTELVNYVLKSDFLNNLNSAFFLIDKKGKILSCNVYSRKVFGLLPEEMFGKSFKYFFAEGNNEEKIITKIQKAFNGTPQQFHFWAKNKAGETFYTLVQLHKSSIAGYDVVVATVDVLPEKIEADKETRFTEKHYSILLDSMYDLIFVTQNGKIIYTNKVFEEKLGFKFEEVEGHKFEEFVCKGEKRTITNFLKKEKTEESISVTAKTKSGEKKFFEVRQITILWNSAPAKLLILRDLTFEQNELLLKQKIEKEEKKYRNVVDNMYEAIVIINPDGEIIFINSSMEKLVKIKKEFIIGKDFLSFIHPDDREIVRKRFQLRLNRTPGVPVNYSLRIRDKLGGIVWVQANPLLINWEDGKVIVAFLRDITKEKEYQERLTESESKYRMLVENISESVIVTSDFKLKYFNDAFMRDIEASSPSELMGKDIKLLIHPDDFMNIFEDYETKKVNEFHVLRIKTLKGNEKWFYVRAAKVTWEGKEAYLSVLTDITRQKQVEKKLKENQLLLETLIEATKDDIISFKDGDGRWLLANKAQLELLHLEGVDYIGKTNSELAKYSPFYEHYFEKWQKLDELCWETRVPMRYDAEVPLPTGETLIFDAIKVPIFNDDGSRKFLIIIGRNVTEERETQKELKKSEEKYKSLVENLQEAIVITRNGVIEFCNNAFCKLTGYEASQLLGRSIINYISPEDRPFVIETHRRGIRLKIAKEPYEFMLLRKDGTNVWVRNKSINIEWNKNDDAVLSFMSDFTKERKALEELRKLSVAVEQSQQSFMILNDKMEIEYVNPYLEKEFGKTEEELLGKTPAELIPDQASCDIIVQNISKLKEGEVWQGEIVLQDATGKEFWGLSIISPITNMRGKITNYAVIFIDIEELKKIENELIEAKQKAIKNAELKSFFLAQMSHEIRTPVNSILSLTELLEDELADELDEDLKFIFKSIKNSGRRIFRTVDLLLNMSELKVGSYEPKMRDVDVDMVIKSVLGEYLKPAEEKGIKVIYEKRSENLILHNHDEFSILQIFMQIMDNAVKYTEEGEIRIIATRPQKNKLIVAFRDTGIGISEEYLPKLFADFSQERSGYTRPFDGNGLGLALAKEFAEINGAEIDVDSIKGEGSIFTVTFRDKKN
jgi:PAS domain S-box-containing protein